LVNRWVTEVSDGPAASVFRIEELVFFAEGGDSRFLKF
jgi:hypothetical protein